MFTASIAHSKTTIHKFTIVQYDTFEFGRKVLLALLSMVLVILGVIWLMNETNILGIICLVFGCLIITNLNSRAQSVADAVVNAMNGSYPTLHYSFDDNGFSDGEGRPTVSYSKIYRLLQDEDYLYIFTGKATGYMMTIASVGGMGSAADLKKMLSEKTGLEWSKPASLVSFSLWDAVKLFRSKTGIKHR